MSTDDSTAEKALRSEAEARYPRLNADMMRSNQAFIAGAEWGRASRDTEVAEAKSGIGVYVDAANAGLKRIRELEAYLLESQAIAAEAQATIEAANAFIEEHEHPDDWNVPCVYTKGLRAILSVPSSTGGWDGGGRE